MAREVRKTVTVLFADVVGSTSLGEQLDPEALRRVLARWFDTVRATLEGHGASVEKFIGDAVMAVFGVPQVHEDDALRAVRAAAELGERLADVNSELEREYGVAVEARVGINTGEVVTGTEERLVTGDAVNLAARLEQSAAPGEILLGESTYALVRDAVQAEPVELAVRGKAGPVTARRLVRTLADVAAAPRAEAPLVGRSRELDELRSAYHEALSAQACRMVTVLGPPGIGKSRLATELVEEVGAEATVLVGRCPAYGEGATYWPLVEIVRSAAHHEARARIVDLLQGEQDSELIADRLAAAVGSGESVAAASEEIFWAVRRLFERLARERPLVVVVEDVHWAQPTFLDLLEYLAGWTADAPVLLACLARPDLVEERPSWLGVGRTVTLEPLSPDESVALVEHWGNGGVDEERRARIVERAGGNPLFLEQLRAVTEAPGSELPPTIQAVLAARLDRLPPAERAALERAAVVGREFWRGAVSELSPAEERPALASSLLALARKGLVRPERSAFPGEDGFRFHHVLIRDAAYDALPKATRAELHQRIARWLAAKDLEHEREHDEIVGYHLEQAYRYRTELGPPDEAAEALAREAAERLAAAGRQAFGRIDMPATANLLGRASALLGADDPLAIDLAPQLGLALRLTGELEQAEVVLAESVAAAEALGDERLAARPQAAALEVSLARPDVDPERIRRAADSLRSVFERAGDDLGLALTWSLLAQVAWLEARALETAHALELGIEHCRRADARSDELQLLDMLVMTFSHGPTPVDEGVRRCSDVLRSAGGSRLVEAAVERALGRFAAMRGEFEEARGRMKRGTEILDELGLAAHSAASRGQGTAFVETLAGDDEAAERALRESFDRLDAMGEQSFLSTTAAVLAEVVLSKGATDEAERLTEISEAAAAPRDVASQAQIRAVRARILARRGNLDDAERLAREAVEVTRDSDFVDLRASVLFSLAEVLWRRGEVEGARGVAHEALAVVEAKGNIAMLARIRQALDEVGAEAPSS